MRCRSTDLVRVKTRNICSSRSPHHKKHRTTSTGTHRDHTGYDRSWAKTVLARCDTSLSFVERPSYRARSRSSRGADDLSQTAGVLRMRRIWWIQRKYRHNAWRCVECLARAKTRCRVTSGTGMPVYVSIRHAINFIHAAHLQGAQQGRGRRYHNPSMSFINLCLAVSRPPAPPRSRRLGA